MLILVVVARSPPEPSPDVADHVEAVLEVVPQVVDVRVARRYRYRISGACVGRPLSGVVTADVGRWSSTGACAQTRPSGFMICHPPMNLLIEAELERWPQELGGVVAYPLQRCLWAIVAVASTWALKVASARYR